jgi:hypothetical protein
MAPSSIFIGKSEIENRYFHHFQQTAAMGLDGAWGWSLWNQLMPQNGNQEPFIEHSIIAVGALLKSHEEAYSAGVHPHAIILPDIAKLHRAFAIVKYDTAIQLMQRAICAGTTNPRQALLGCIFVVCFEMLLGNRDLAVKHALSGTIILEKWRAQVLALKGEQPLLLSPSPLTIEDEIVEAFQNLDIQITAFMGGRSAARHEMMNDHCTTIAALPTSFSKPSLHNLRDAQVYLNHIVRRIHHFIATTWSPPEALAMAKGSDGKLAAEVSVMASMNVYITSFRVNDTIRAQQARFATEIANWIHAFAPLLDCLRTKREHDGASFLCTYNIATMMQMQSIATTILTAGVVITNEMEYDKFNPQFRELVDLATAVVKLRQRRKKDNTWAGGFWIDIGVTPQLFVVVTRCRDPIIRREAIKLLQGWYIEGSWDPRLVAHIGQFIMEVEEEGMTDVEWGGGYKSIIPETARVVFARLSEDPQEGRVLMHCVPKNGGVDGKPVWREKYVKW